MLDEEELPAFVRGKLCDIMPLFSFSVCVCVCVVCLLSFSKKKKKMRKMSSLVCQDLKIYEAKGMYWLPSFLHKELLMWKP